MSIQVVFFDIDGTLIDKNKKPADKTIDALNQLKENNIKVILCTGRSSIHFEDIREMFHIDSYICFNGAYAVYEGDVIFKQPMDHNSLEKLMLEVDDNQHRIVFSNNINSYANFPNDEHIETTFNSLNVAQPLHHATIWQDEPMYQGYLYCTPEEEVTYATNHPGIKFTRWHEYAVDINNYNMNKAVGIKAYLKHLNIAPENAAAFGDNLNDLEMLAYVGYGIAMGNGLQEAKDKADFVTKSLDENGIYYGLKHLNLI